LDRPFTRDDAGRSGEVDIGTLVGILLRQWLMIGVITALVVGAGLTYVVLAPKTWESTARVLLDPRDKQVAGIGLSQPMQGIDTVWVDTQANIVTSAAILSAVIDRLGLDKDPEFGGTRDETLRALVGATVVQRADQTYVLDISVRSRAADRAARIAQTIAEQFVANQVEVKQATVREASELINRQLDELRGKARDAREKLEAYKRENGVLTANGRSVDEDALRQLNDAYVAARVRTQDAKARRDKIVAARTGGSEASLGGIDSSVLSRLKIERALAARSMGELSQELGPNHPRMVAARGDVARADAQIAEELKSMAASAETEFQVASAAEAAARKALDDASAVVTDSGERTIELRELDNEATLRADMYKAYVTRTEEIALQAHTQVSDSRVIAPASVPLYPFAPRKTIVLALSMIAGFGLALSIAIYRGRRFLPEFETRRDLPEIEESEPEIAPAALRPIENTEATANTLADDPDQSDDEPDDGSVPPVLAEFEITTRPVLVGRTGLRVPPSAEAILGSAVNDDEGQPRPEALAAFAQLNRLIKAASGQSRLLLVLGADFGPASAAVAFGLANVAARGGVLLVDASWDELPLSRAFTEDALPGVIDVVAGRNEATDAALCEQQPDVTLIGIGDPDRVEEIAANTGRIASFLETLAEDFGRVIVNFGHRYPPELLAAMVGKADAVLIVADAIVEADEEAAEMVRNLADALPAFTGLVLVSERRATARRAHGQA
jgi:uncharacterized protein involved in exopolysaccharide biosynthesis